MSSIAATVPNSQFARAYRRNVGHMMQAGKTCVSSREGMASVLVDCMVTPARRVDLAVRYEDFDLYREAILRNLDRKDDSKMRIVFHDVGIRSFLPLPPAMEVPVATGRVKLYAQSQAAHFDEFLIVGMMGGKVHTRIHEAREKAALARFKWAGAEQHILDLLFGEIVSKAAALTP